jgi:hypothetical protein
MLQIWKKSPVLPEKTKVPTSSLPEGEFKQLIPEIPDIIYKLPDYRMISFFTARFFPSDNSKR